MTISDELSEAMRPYGGGESYPPYFGLRIGRITKVYAQASDVTESDDKDRFVGSMRVQWLDQTSAGDQLVPWSYPSFSNPNIKRTEALTTATPSVGVVQSSVGSAYGIFHTPSVGDLVVCGFRGPASPIVVGYLPHNLNKQQLSTASKTQQNLLSFGPFPIVLAGEFVIQSLQQAQIYLDRAGTVQIITKTQPSGSGKPPIDETQLPSTEVARISLGVTYDSTFTTPVQSSAGQNVICNINLANGSHVQIDAAGNVDIKASNNMTLTGVAVNVNNGSKAAARQDDATLSNTVLDSTFWTFITTLFTTFNTHVHVSASPGNPTSVPAPLLLSSPTTLTGKVNAGSSTVKIG